MSEYHSVHPPHAPPPPARLTQDGATGKDANETGASKSEPLTRRDLSERNIYSWLTLSRQVLAWHP